MVKGFLNSFLSASRGAVCITLLWGTFAFASNELAQTFTLDGQLMIAGTTTALSDSAAVLKIDILDPTKTCVLYEEQQTVNTVSSDGYFSVQVGSVTGAAKRTSSDPGLTMAQIFQNTSAVTATSASGSTCAGGTYTPAADAVRYFRITVTPSSTNVADVLSPDTTIDAAPMAMVAQTLQGYQATDFLAKAGLPSCASGTFLTYDGTNMTCAGVAGASGGTVTSITAGTGLTGGTITTSGTIALSTSGVTAGTYGSTSAVPVVTVDGYGRVTNVTTASISGSPTGAASGDLSGTYPGPTVNGLSGTALSISSLTNGQYLKYNGTNWINSTLSVSDSQITYASEAANTFLAAPNGSAGAPLFRTLAAADLPTVPYTRGGTGLTATPANGQLAIGNGSGYTLGTLTAGSGVTITNTAGGITIAAAGSGGTVTSVSGTAPISVATGTTTPVVSISQSTSSTDGYLSAADWTTFNSKLSSSLASGNILVGNSSGGAVPVALSGDATLSSAGALTLATVATAGTYEKVVVNAKGLVTSGSSLSASDITTALGYTPVNKAGDSMSGNLTFASTKGTIYTDSSSNTATIEAPTTISTSYVLKLPAAVASSAGQVLTSDTSGNLSWSTPSTTATSYSGILPIANGGTNSSAALTGNQVMVSTTAGKIVEGGALGNGQLMIGSSSGAPIPASLTAGSGITITNAANSITIAASASMPSLPSGDIFVGNSSGGAAAVAMSGDVTMTNAGVTTVGKIQGTTVSGTTPTTAGQVFRYNGSAWTPNFVSMADLRSTITGATALTSCGSNQTLTWTAVADNLTCANIAISDSQITYGSEAANTFLAAPNGSAGVPTYRAIASADLPAGTLTGSGTANYIPYYSTASSMANSPLYVSSGNVGIGTTGPAYALDVVGTIRVNETSNTTPYFVAQSQSLNQMMALNRANDAINGSLLVGSYGGIGLVPNNANPSATSSSALFINTSGNVGIGTTAPASRLHVGVAPTASTNYGLLSLGSGAFDGTTTGFFVGNGSGTMIAANAASGYTGDLVNLQIAGVSKFRVDAAGDIISTGATTSSGNTTSTGNYSTSGNISTTGTGTITSAGNIIDSSTTASTSSTTGALTVAGGVGISGALYTGSTINSTGSITSGGVYKAAYGTAAAPSYTYTSDSTTGNFAPSAGIWAVSTNGTERMRVTSSGFLGVGTTSPAAPLDISTSFPNFTPSSSTGFILNTEGSGTKPNDNVTAASSTTAQLNMYYFQARGITATNTGVTTTQANSVNIAGPPIPNTNETFTNSASLYIGAGGSASNTVTNGYGLYANAPVSATNNYAATFMGGDVGVGTSNPSALLHVSYADSSTYSPTSTTATVPWTAGSSAVTEIQNSSWTTGSASYLAFDAINSSDANELSYIGTVSTTSANYSPAMVFGTRTGLTAYSERMRIDSSGYVGIGTTSPAAALDVYGTASTSGAGSFARFGPSDLGDAFAIGNFTSVSGRVSPGIVGQSNHSTYAGLNIVGRGTDSANQTAMVNFLAGVGSGDLVSGTVAASTNAPAYEFYNGSNLIMTMFASGNVGLGGYNYTNGPWPGSYSLGFVGTTARTIGVERSVTASILAGNNLAINAGGASLGGSNLNGGNLVLSSGVSTGSGTSQIQFNVYPGTASATSDNAAITAMTIANGGYVGIGTTSPAAALDVNLSDTGGATQAKFGTSLPVYAISNYPNIGFNSYFSSTWRFGAGSSSDYAGGIGLNPVTGQLSFFQSSATGSAGASATMNTNMIINQNGYVGIATTAPTALLSVYGNGGYSGGIQTQWSGSGGTAWSIVHGTTQGLYFGYGTAGSETNVAEITTAGAYTQISDRRLKKDIKPITGALNTALALKGVQYHWKDEKIHGSESQLGVIAQDVEPLVPQAVTTGKDGIKQVSYTTFVPLLIEAVKDIYHHFTERMDSQDRAIASIKADTDAKDKEIAALKIRAEKAEKEAAEIKARLERIEKALNSK